MRQVFQVSIASILFILFMQTSSAQISEFSSLKDTAKRSIEADIWIENRTHYLFLTVSGLEDSGSEKVILAPLLYANAPDSWIFVNVTRKKQGDQYIETWKNRALRKFRQLNIIFSEVEIIFADIQFDDTLQLRTELVTLLREFSRKGKNNIVVNVDMRVDDGLLHAELGFKNVLAFGPKQQRWAGQIVAEFEKAHRMLFPNSEVGFACHSYGNGACRRAILSYDSQPNFAYLASPGAMRDTLNKMAEKLPKDGKYPSLMVGTSEGRNLKTHEFHGPTHFDGEILFGHMLLKENQPNLPDQVRLAYQHSIMIDPSVLNSTNNYYVRFGNSAESSTSLDAGWLPQGATPLLFLRLLSPSYRADLRTGKAREELGLALLDLYLYMEDEDTQTEAEIQIRFKEFGAKGDNECDADSGRENGEGESEGEGGENRSACDDDDEYAVGGEGEGEGEGDNNGNDGCQGDDCPGGGGKGGGGNKKYSQDPPGPWKYEFKEQKSLPPLLYDWRKIGRGNEPVLRSD